MAWSIRRGGLLMDNFHGPPSPIESDLGLKTEPRVEVMI